MAMMAAGPALGAIGGIIGAFGKNKLKQHEYLKGGLKEGQSILGDLAGDRAKGESAWEAYNTRQQQRAGDYSRLGKQAETDFGSLLSKGQGADQDPYNVYGNLRSGNLAALRDFGDYLGQVGQKQENQARAMLGYSGDRGGSYADALRSNRLGSVIGNQFGNIMAGLTPAMQSIVAGRQSNLGSLVDLINRRTDTAGIGEGIELSPADAAFALRNAGIGNLSNLINTAKLNTSGFTSEPNTVAKIGQGFQAAGNALSLGGMMGGGGGGMGNIMGMLGGGGGGGSAGGGMGSLAAFLPQNTSGLDNWGDLGYLQKMQYQQALQRAQGINPNDWA